MTETAEKITHLYSDSLKEILIPVQDEIKELEVCLYELVISQIPFVNTVAHYVLKNGGKRLRPLLTIVCAKLAGYSGKEAAQLGASIEFIHTASLLHDDVVDNAQIRRGKTSTNAKWGNHISVLMGDFFYSRASQILIQQGNPKIMQVVADCTVTTTEGEIFEVIKSSDLSTSQEEYLSIIENKTAHLFATACHMGAVLGGVSDFFEQALRHYGLCFGMAFQLADDVMDYVSSEDRFGKSKGTDLREGKLTLPLILALKRAEPAEVQLLKNAVLSDVVDQDTFVKVRDVINRTQGFKDTQVLAQDYIQKAKDSLSPFRASLEKDILLSLADYVIYRDK